MTNQSVFEVTRARKDETDNCPRCREPMIAGQLLALIHNTYRHATVHVRCLLTPDPPEQPAHPRDPRRPA